MRTTTTVLILLACSAPAARADVAFSEKPRAERAGDSVQIRFAVSGPTDVEVAVLDAGGNVVRHLAAGMLGGEDAPPAPLQPGLSQEISWDGNDDAGKPATGGPFRVRVALGLTPRMHRIIGWSGQNLDGANGLVAGPDGTLYAISSSGLYAHRQTWLVTALDREGRYLRQVFPGPANLPAEKRKGWPRIALDDGSEVPVVFHLLPRTTYPGAVFGRRTFPVATSDGRLVFLSGPGATTIKYPDIRGGRRLLILGTDGSVPEDFLGPVICPLVGGTGHVALSPDERYVYATGFVDTGRKGRGPVNVVYRVRLDGSGPSEVLIGRPYETDDGPAGLSDPQGIATDAAGNLYVADYGHDRIAVFRPDGSYLDTIPVEQPDTVLVSRRTGAIYVMQIEERTKSFDDQHYYVPAHNWRAKRVVKFGSLKDKTARAVYENTQVSRYGGGAFMALDESGDEPVLWVTGLKYQGGPVFKLADRGDRFESLGTPVSDRLAADDAECLGFIGDVTAVGDRVITRHPAFGMHTNASFVYSAETGEYLGHYVPKREDGRPENMWNLLYGETVAGRDGRLYVHADSHVIRRYDAGGRQVPFGTTETNAIEGFWHGHTRGAGMFVDAEGTIYVPAAKANRELEEMHVKVVGPDGVVRNESLVEVHGSRLGGIAVDSRGSVYLGVQAVPKDERIPPSFAGKLPEDGETGHPSNGYLHVGAIYKFPASGGRFVVDPDGPLVGHAQYKPVPLRVEGHEWMRRLGLIGNHGHELGCHCETTRFDLDRFDRLFVPDPFRFCVHVLDASGNTITRFGAYGNMDSRGPESPVPEPAIPLGWPLSVECAGGRAFIADLVNRRIVAVGFEHAAVGECAVP